MKKTKGFTLIEVLITVLIIGVLLTLAMPSMTQSMSYGKKSQANTARRIIVNAIDYWVKDNINPVQRPSDFNSVNSQGNTVADYITNEDIFNTSDLKIKTENINGETHKIMVKDKKEEESDLNVDFDEGILYIGYGYKEKNSFYHCVLGDEYFDRDKNKLKDAGKLINQNRIVKGYEYKEYV